MFKSSVIKVKGDTSPALNNMIIFWLGEVPLNNPAAAVICSLRFSEGWDSKTSREFNFELKSFPIDSVSVPFTQPIWKVQNHSKHRGM
jgi:hypothetical protein